MPPLTLKLTTVGNSIGAAFPKEVLAKLKVTKGDTLFLIETSDGLLPTPSLARVLAVKSATYANIEPRPR